MWCLRAEPLPCSVVFGLVVEDWSLCLFPGFLNCFPSGADRLGISRGFREVSARMRVPLVCKSGMGTNASG